MRAQAAADGQTGPAEGACAVVQEGVNAAGGAGMHTLHCGAWGGRRGRGGGKPTDRQMGGRDMGDAGKMEGDTGGRGMWCRDSEEQNISKRREGEW